MIKRRCFVLQLSNRREQSRRRRGTREEEDYGSASVHDVCAGADEERESDSDSNRFGDEERGFGCESARLSVA